MSGLMKMLVVAGLLCCAGLNVCHATDAVVYEGRRGPGAGRQIVFLTGDEEYRSEGGLPQMAKILAERYGFKCTVLFAINPTNGAIDPNYNKSLPGAEALDSADVIVMLL